MIATEHGADRERMVRTQIESRGIRDPRILEVFRTVPRHLFVPPVSREEAHDDRPLEIGGRQTISQPYIAARMTEALALRGGEKVLEVGTGSGYQTAILLALGARVWSIERLPELLASAARNLEASGYAGATLRVGDGSLGWTEEAPFDRILVAAGAPDVPIALLQQLAEGGLLVVPVGDEERQELLRYRRARGRVEREVLEPVRFVKLVGAEGWPP